MDTIIETANRQMRALVPVLEREIARYTAVEEATRGSFLHDRFAHALGVRQRGLAAILRSLNRT